MARGLCTRCGNGWCGFGLKYLASSVVAQVIAHEVVQCCLPGHQLVDLATGAALLAFWRTVQHLAFCAAQLAWAPGTGLRPQCMQRWGGGGQGAGVASALGLLRHLSRAEMNSFLVKDSVGQWVGRVLFVGRVTDPSPSICASCIDVIALFEKSTV